MDSEVKSTIYKTVSQMLADSTSLSNIQRLETKHKAKIHFVPLRYRIVGGILQGLNIKFGNFIEQLIRNVVEIDASVSVMEDSGKKIKLFFTQETDQLIDGYITNRQLSNSPDDCAESFDELLKKIVEIENNASAEERQGVVKDIDGLFKTSEGLIVYTELKYNDDHDTGKFVDINRKFLKTWAGLAVRYGIESSQEILPILYYFNPTKRYGPIFTPSKNIMRGEQLFDTFLETDYSEIDFYLSELGDSPEVLAIFDEMYQVVRTKEIV